jgi:hypothetical protein
MDCEMIVCFVIKLFIKFIHVIPIYKNNIIFKIFLVLAVKQDE